MESKFIQGKSLSKYVIFDRDGTLIKFVSYLHKKEDIILIDGVIKALKLLKDNNCKLFLHTNQSGVSRGYFKLEDVKVCNQKMIELIGLGNIFEDICVATDFPPKDNTYRKPSPKFGLEIIKKYQIEASNLIYVGDNISDLQTAKNVGCKAFGVNYGVSNLKAELKKRGDLDFIIYDDINSVAKAIIKLQ